MTDLSVPLLDLQEVIDRIRAQCPGLTYVEDIIDLGAAQEHQVGAPAVWVLPAPDEAESSDVDAMLVSQTINVSWVILIAIQNYPHTHGAGGSRELRTIRQWLMSALLGWYPTAAERGAWYLRGAPVSYSDNLLWWEESYATEIRIHQSRNP